VTAVGSTFLRRAVAWFAAHGVRVQEILTDNGSPYCSGLWAAACAELRITHLRTKPYRPRTNGKAERFIQTMLREWAYAQSYPSTMAPPLQPHAAARQPRSQAAHQRPGSLTNVTGNYS
jgi:transposase InsO family protein